MLVACVLCVLQAATQTPAQPQRTLDRNAFTFTEYKLNATIDPAKHAISIEGDITLRNDSEKPQSAASLQISSTLQWKTITVGGKAASRADQKIASDVDHSGSVSEAVLNLEPVAPKSSFTVHVSYAGTVELDTTRLRRVGTPENVAEQSDWDRIGPDITALRGVGYVQWYPVSMDPAALTDQNVVFDNIARWKGRHQESLMSLTLRTSDAQLKVVSSGEQSQPQDGSYSIQWRRFGMHTPVIVAAQYETIPSANGPVSFLPGSTETAQRYANIFGLLRPAKLPTETKATAPVKLVQVPASFGSFEADHLLLTPFNVDASEAALKLSLMHPAAHAYFRSNRAWLDEGFAHWAQLIAIKDASGRSAALDALNQREPALALRDAGQPADAQPLVAAYDEIFYRTKASFVWWMLYDMVGQDKVMQAVQTYSPERDREPSYFQKLLEQASRRDLEQFFDDWVYRDRGLSEFKISDVYSRQNLTGGYLVTVTVENSGGAGAEVGILGLSQQSQNSSRLWVPAKGKASSRITLPLQPLKVVVNDGGVPEYDPTDNVYTVQPKP